ncbi:MAG TPA: zf-HC2 domain-containing protein [Kineosporiaceae bacterium]|nr:zf-HC2 domain-containing protein [Kineosporiaceae bacterium]
MTTRTEEWHADPALLSRYLAGALDAVTGSSVEQHVNRCATCRNAVGSLLEPRLVERTWAGIREAVERPSLPSVLRLARRCGLPEPTAVLLAGAASLRGAWLVGAFLSLCFATMAAYASGGTALAPFLLVAPLAPVLGVGAAYGPRQDPLEALIATAPYGRTKLILLRTIAVLVSVLPGTALLGLAIPGPSHAAAAVSLAWSGVVLGSTRALAPTWPVEAAQQGVYLGLAVAACAVIAIRAGADRQPGVAL